jgi:hypothetical protein
LEDNYNLDKIIIGNLITTVHQGMMPVVLTEGPYIFYQQQDGLYKEIFTEEVYDICKEPSMQTGGRDYQTTKNIETNKFGKTYIQRSSLFDFKLNANELQNQKVSKKRIIEIFKEVLLDNEKQKEEEKQLEKQYLLNHKRK